MSRKKKLRAIAKMLSASATVKNTRPVVAKSASPLTAKTTLAKSTEMQIAANALLWKGWGNSPDPAEREAFRQLSADPRNAHYERGL